MSLRTLFFGKPRPADPLPEILQDLRDRENEACISECLCSPKFLCAAAHDIPDRHLLESSVEPKDRASYYPLWLARNDHDAGFHPIALSILQVHTLCIAFALPHQMALLPLPKRREAEPYIARAFAPINVAPQEPFYILSYDFASHPSRVGVATTPVTIAQHCGFKIATMPMQDWWRGRHAENAGRPGIDLFYFNRAIGNVSAQCPPEVQERIKHPYARFQKLMALYQDQQHTPEGQLAYTLAREHAQQCIDELSAVL